MSYLSPAEEALIEVPEGRAGWLSLAVDAARTAIDEYCHRQFDLQTRTETYDGTGGFSMALRQYPIVSVTSVSVDGSPLSASSLSFDGRFLYCSTSRFTRGNGNVLVTYQAGYASVPKDIILAQIQTAQAILNASLLDPNTLGESTAGYQATFAPEGAGSIPRAAMSRLTPFVSKFRP